MRIEDEKLCSQQPSQLFPDTVPCKNKPEEYIFGQACCKYHADKLRDTHAKFYKVKGIEII